MFSTMGTKLPAGFYNPVASGAMTFQAMAAFGTAQVGLLHLAVASRALFFPVVSPPQEENYNRNGQEGKNQQPEKGAVIKIPAMPCISPGTRHSAYLR